jgi:hypothetical protein
VCYLKHFWFPYIYRQAGLQYLFQAYTLLKIRFILANLYDVSDNISREAAASVAWMVFTALAIKQLITIHMLPYYDNCYFKWASKWVNAYFFNTKLAIFQLYHGENKVRFDKMITFALY